MSKEVKKRLERKARNDKSVHQLHLGAEIRRNAGRSRQSISQREGIRRLPRKAQG
jgi:hypothetical protein